MTKKLSSPVKNPEITRVCTTKKVVKKEKSAIVTV